MKKILIILSYLILSFESQCQTNSVVTSSFSGIIVGGYVNEGGYLNFTGPNLSWNKKGHQIMLGMLPSLRFKEDSSTIKNSIVTPSLGAGITYIYKSLAFQIPFYYNAKTGLKNGSWQIGIGLGFKISALNKKNK